MCISILKYETGNNHYAKRDRKINKGDNGCKCHKCVEKESMDHTIRDTLDKFIRKLKGEIVKIS